ncbi:MAG: 3-hydroxyacyl-CoA dehydrogenase NAD-binding domain-containing protein [Mariprofundaceae bacterium]|nr:3-hydroxyacyl-CoA dehydrogenase NAD-binding domain-containing protein [Mariprofundaceae bacterium]
MLNKKAWLLTTNEDHTATLTFDCPNASVNTLSRAVMDELDQIIQTIEKQVPTALMLCSGKKAGFIAGADIHDFTNIIDQDAAFAYMRRAQQVFDRLAALPCRTIAMIDGFCLGGGLELALACDYRIASDAAHTRLGFPEVHLGIHPGFGGSVRACALIGGLKALPIMLTGRQLSARQAKRLGLLDVLTPSRHLWRAASALAIQGLPPRSRWRGLSNAPWLRPIIAGFLRRKTAQKVHLAHYPAPFALLDLWQQHGNGGERMFIAEARSVASLVIGGTVKELIRAFFLREQLKTLGKSHAFSFTRIHVIGAGVMGGDIAAWCALRGFHVTLQDQSPDRIAPAIGRAHGLFVKRLKKDTAIAAAMDRLQPDIKGYGIAHADVIIEAVFEDLTVKQTLFRQIEAQAPHHAILASNTSSIPLQQIASVLQEPERLIGLHFFNPVAKMPLIEVVYAKNRDAIAVGHAMAVAHALGKLPLPVASQPGFLVNRILMPYLMQAMLMVEEGVAVSNIDNAATDWGMPIGPLMLADQVGLDVCLHVATVLSEHIGGEIPKVLQKYVQAARLGKKTGQGFYSYPLSKRFSLFVRGEKTPLSKADIRDRLVFSMLNESVACVHEGIIENADFCDAGMIFASGYAPFRGGPMQVIAHYGVAACMNRLSQLETYGTTFKAHAGWDSLVTKEDQHAAA